MKQYAKLPVRSCNGKRLNKAALAVTIGGKNIYDFCQSFRLKAYYAFLLNSNFKKQGRGNGSAADSGNYIAIDFFM